MSWLFDRLCELAVADRVEVVLEADAATMPLHDESFDLVEVLLRAAAVPQMSVCWASDAPMRRPLTADDAITIDLDLLDAGERSAAVERAVDLHRRSDGSELLVAADSVTVRPRAGGAPDDATRGTSGDRPGDVRRVFATDRGGRRTAFDEVASRGLGIAIGGVDPAATVKVEHVLGVVSILDALVTLRSFAFGVRGDEQGAPSKFSLSRSA